MQNPVHDDGFPLLLGGTEEGESKIQALSKHLEQLGSQKPLVLSRLILGLMSRHPASKLDEIKVTAFISAAIKVSNQHGLQAFSVLEKHYVEIFVTEGDTWKTTAN